VDELLLGTPPGRWRLMMLDVLFLAIGLGFFAAGCLYLYACDRL
jgi:hypothetical protein